MKNVPIVVWPLIVVGVNVFFWTISEDKMFLTNAQIWIAAAMIMNSLKPKEK